MMLNMIENLTNRQAIALYPVEEAKGTSTGSKTIKTPKEQAKSKLKGGK